MLYEIIEKSTILRGFNFDWFYENVVEGLQIILKFVINRQIKTDPVPATSRTTTHSYVYSSTKSWTWFCIIFFNKSIICKHVHMYCSVNKQKIIKRVNNVHTYICIYWCTVNQFYGKISIQLKGFCIKFITTIWIKKFNF